jgi:hypothetical protein
MTTAWKARSMFWQKALPDGPTMSVCMRPRFQPWRFLGGKLPQNQLIDQRHARIRAVDTFARAARAESDRLKVDGSETQKITCIRLPDFIWVASDETAVPLPVESILTP